MPREEIAILEGLSESLYSGDRGRPDDDLGAGCGLAICEEEHDMFDDAYGDYGQLTELLPPNVMGAIQTGAVAAVSSVVTQNITNGILEHLDDEELMSPEMDAIIDVGVGIAGAALIWRTSGRQDIAAAWMIGPVAQNLGGILAGLMAKDNGKEKEKDNGNTEGLGLVNVNNPNALRHQSQLGAVQVNRELHDPRQVPMGPPGGIPQPALANAAMAW